MTSESPSHSAISPSTKMAPMKCTNRDAPVTCIAQSTASPPSAAPVDSAHPRSFDALRDTSAAATVPSTVFVNRSHNPSSETSVFACPPGASVAHIDTTALAAPPIHAVAPVTPCIAPLSQFWLVACDREGWEQAREEACKGETVPPATRASLSALCLRDNPDDEGFRSVKKESGILLRVPARVGYSLRSTRTWVGIREICPLPSPRYVCAPRDGTVQIRMSLERGLVSEDILDDYEEILATLPDTAEGRSDIGGRGLYVDEDVPAGTLLIEYTGNRVTEKNSERIHSALDALWQNPDVFVYVPSERATIDPRGCGNAAMFVNHSCEPNALLTEVGLGDRTLVFIRSLVPMKAGTEVQIDYGYSSVLSNCIMICECNAPSCRNTV